MTNDTYVFYFKHDKHHYKSFFQIKKKNGSKNTFSLEKVLLKSTPDNSFTDVTKKINDPFITVMSQEFIDMVSQDNATNH